MTQFNICFNCEYALSEPQKFCPNCGAQLDGQITNPFPQPPLLPIIIQWRLEGEILSLLMTFDESIFPIKLTE